VLWTGGRWDGVFVLRPPVQDACLLQAVWWGSLSIVILSHISVRITPVTCLPVLDQWCTQTASANDVQTANPVEAGHRNAGQAQGAAATESAKPHLTVR